MTSPITEAQPALEFIAPDYNPLVTGAVRSLLPLWLRWKVQIPEIQVTGGKRLVELYRQFDAGKIRFMMAFRHPSTNDPFCMGQLLWKALPQVARKQGITLPKTPHAHFIYDRGIPLWAGDRVGWLYSKLGCTPIRRGRVDLAGLRSIRKLFTDGQFPMAAAPEGGTNGHNEIVSPIEPGIAQFGFWCMEDLLKADRTEQVLIVPLGIQYRFLGQPWRSIEQLLEQLEEDSGLTEQVKQEGDRLPALEDDAVPMPEQEAALYRRLYRLGEYLLKLMEGFYTKFYHQDLKALAETLPEPTVTPHADSKFPANQELAKRLQTLLNAALTVAEQYFKLSSKGTVTDRCRRIEQAGWDWIYREDIKQLEALSPVEKGLADRIAEEASLRVWHMRLVESFVSVTGQYVIEKPTVDRFAETLLLVWEMIVRIQGKPSFPRPQLGKQRVMITVGEPLNMGDRWSDYQSNRRQALGSLTQDLQTTLESMVVRNWEA